MGEGLRGNLWASGGQPALAVFGLDVANRDACEKRREVFDAGIPANHAAGLEGVGSVGHPAGGNLGERQSGIIGNL